MLYFSRWRISNNGFFEKPMYDFLYVVTSDHSSKLLSFWENSVFFAFRRQADRQTNKQTQTNRWTAPIALSRSRYCERRLNNEERFRSIQQFKDNAVNPCIESTYKFIDHVISQLKQMHDGIQQLSVYHVGGDEVAEGAWSLSPACQHLKQHHRQSGAISSADLKTYFIERSSC